MMNRQVYAIIMAGGAGERLWPQSRRSHPKQLLSLWGRESLIQASFRRLSGFINSSNILVVATESLSSGIKAHLPEMPSSNVIEEPVGRNTAPCLVLAALHVQKFGNPVMVIVPSDHIIKDETKFTGVIQSAVKIAQDYEGIVTVGIAPTAPETGYGYIHRGDPFKPDKEIYRVKRFEEKPDRATAERYLADGNYFWNSGMFVVRVSVLLDLVQKHLPGLYAGLPELRRALENRDRVLLRQCYERLESISIDYGIMEKADNVLMVPGNFGWDDVGSWTALERIRTRDKRGNVINGEHAGVDTSNCIIQGESKLIATVGLQNFIIVETKDIILVCPKNRAQDVKLLVKRLEKEGKNQYL